ncbi:hypothetical protein BGZ58_002271 [Dissophora ornata]|nr:hypothetical protein BGZ58_002271 [Dissophora ornata]
MSPMMHLASFAGLPPELQVMIVSLLDDAQDLHSCTLVSRDWHNVFNPILWKAIKSYRVSRRTRRDADEISTFVRSAAATGSLKKYGHHIRTLKIECMDEDFQLFHTVAPRKFSLLHSIELMGHVSSDDLIADLLWRCSRRRGGVGLQRVVFDLDDCGYDGSLFAFGKKSVRALKEHFSTLEVFCVEAPEFSSKEIQELLCATPRLRVFNILSKDRKQPIKFCKWLDASDVVHQDWSCTSLRVFGCLIGGIPRSDIERELHDGPTNYHVLKGDHQKSIALQKRVYSQIARLTHLQELRMGIPYDTERLNYRRHDKESERQYDCLAMSLDSGLDLLGGLESLEVVALEDMEVGIDDENEQRWVELHWPRVQVFTTDFGTDRDDDSQLSDFYDGHSDEESEYYFEDYYYDEDEYDQGDF